MQVVLIGNGATASSHSVDEIGAKAYNLARMAALGLPIPPAFVLPVSLCHRMVAGDNQVEQELREGLQLGMAFLEKATGNRFGDRRRPLLVSVRSGAPRSMPGMMDTVLDVGATLTAVAGLVRLTGDPRFAWDCRQRFIESYATVVAAAEPAPFAAALSKLLHEESADAVRQLDGEAMERLAIAFEAVVGRDSWLEDPMYQLAGAARAVFQSWMSDRAQTYRRLQNLDHLPGTAVTVQAMVFGNRGLASGAGVAFSRDPSTGEAHPVIDVLFDAQGEEIVSGRRTPHCETALASMFPAISVQLREILRKLEHEFKDVQDVEFTIENGRLWILQTRAAKRTPIAALRIAIDLVHEGLVTSQQALNQLSGLDFNAIVRDRLDAPGEPVACGVGASGGVAAGRIALDSAGAERLSSTGDPVILVRPDTSTADVAGFAVSAGIVTARGGRTAHAALVARQMGKPSIVGCEELAIDSEARRARFAGATVSEGDWISIDGDSGSIYLGRPTIRRERPTTELAELERWRQQAHADHAAA